MFTYRVHPHIASTITHILLMAESAIKEAPPSALLVQMHILGKDTEAYL